VKRALTLAALALTGAGCVSPPRPPDRGELIRGILTSTVQLRSEREGAIHRAASGVVVAADPRSDRSWIITARHFVDPSPPHNIYVRLPGRIGVTPATLAFVSPDRDLAVIEAKYLDVAPARLKMTASLGDEILVIAFPWGQRFTVVGCRQSGLHARQHHRTRTDGGRFGQLRIERRGRLRRADR